MIEVATTKAKEDPIKLVKKMLITLIKYRMKWEIHQAVLVMSAKTIVDTEEALIEVVVEETEVIITGGRGGEPFRGGRGGRGGEFHIFPG